MLLTEHTQKIQEQVVQLIDFMKEMGVEIDESASDGKDYCGLIEACRVAFQNYSENKTAL